MSLDLDGNTQTCQLYSDVWFREQLVDSNKADDESKYCYNLSVVYELTQIMDEPTLVLITNLLNLFLTTCPDQYSFVLSLFLLIDTGESLTCFFQEVSAKERKVEHSALVHTQMLCGHHYVIFSWKQCSKTLQKSSGKCYGQLCTVSIKDLVSINSGESPTRFLRDKSSVPSIINSLKVI